MGPVTAADFCPWQDGIVISVSEDRSFKVSPKDQHFYKHRHSVIKLEAGSGYIALPRVLNSGVTFYCCLWISLGGLHTTHNTAKQPLSQKD